MKTICQDDTKLIEKFMGESLFVRAIPFHYVGRLIAVDDEFLLLDDVSWVADSGRFHVALRDGDLSEVEPYPGKCLIARAAICDVSPWLHELPTEAK